MSPLEIVDVKINTKLEWCGPEDASNYRIITDILMIKKDTGRGARFQRIVEIAETELQEMIKEGFTDA